MAAKRRSVLDSIKLKEFQQPINCCNITSLAYAFSVVGKSISVNDVFHMARLPGDFVVLDGMTLAETHNAAVEVAAQLGDVFVETYHFDEELVDYEAFEHAILSDTGDTDDQLILNFSVKIAHQRTSGGGHFALVGDAEHGDDGELIITMCDVHPMKYGKVWQCSARNMFDAMVDKDSDANRSRGLIRVGRQSASHGIPGLERARKAVSYCDPAFDQARQAWLARFGSLPADSFQMVMNLGGVTASALAITGLTGSKPNEVCLPDDIMRVLRLDYTQHLTDLLQPSEVEQLLSDYAEKAELGISTETVAVGSNASEFLTMLSTRVVFPDNKEQKNGSVVLLLFDLNTAMGVPLIEVDPESEAARLSHFSIHWAIVVGVRPEENRVTIADPRSKITTRLWEAAIDDLWLAINQVDHPKAVCVSKAFSQ